MSHEYGREYEDPIMQHYYEVSKVFGDPVEFLEAFPPANYTKIRRCRYRLYKEGDPSNGDRCILPAGHEGRHAL